MKKILSLALVLCMLFGCVSAFAFTASAADEVVDLLNEKTLNHTTGGTFTWEGGALKAANVDLGDTAIMSELFIEPGTHVYLEATAKLTAGEAWGIILGEIDYEAPFVTGWMCVNYAAGGHTSRGFSIGTASTLGKPYEITYWDEAFGVGQEHTVGFEITADGTAKLYIDGIQYGTRSDWGWDGGYVGLMTYMADVEFSSYTLKYGAPENYTVFEQGAKNELKFKETINVLEDETLFENYANPLANFEYKDGIIIGSNTAIGDSAITSSDLFIEPGEHVYLEMTGIVREGNAFGIFLGESDYMDPLNTGWICLNAGVIVHDSRLFDIGANIVVNDPFEMKFIGEGLNLGDEITLGLEITADDVFYVSVNGQQYGERTIPTWQGGYVGLMTYMSSTDFISYTLNYVDDNAAEAPVVEEPVVEEPVVEEPVVEEPVIEEPAVEEPVVEAPVAEAPKTADAIVVLLACMSAASAAAISFKKRH